MRLWSRQQQAAPRRDLLRAERCVWIRQHEQHCGGESAQSFLKVFFVPKFFPNSELSYKKHLSPSLPARPGTARWRTWQLIVPRTVTSTSLGIDRSLIAPKSTMSFPRSGTSTGTIGHYTRVVWAESSRLGCGKRDRYVVCNYLGGNMSGSSMYKQVTQLFINHFQE